MESRINNRRTYEEQVEIVTKISQELLRSELFKMLVERESQGNSGTGPAERQAPPWVHALIDAIWDAIFGN